MQTKKKNREYLFYLLFPIGYGYLYMLEHMQKELGDNGIIWLSVFLVLVILLIGRFIFSNNKINIEKEKEKIYLDADEYVKGVQISISLSKNMLEDPYFVNGEHFYKMRIVLKYLEPLLALGIISSFFLPWVHMDSMDTSLYELLKLENFGFIQSLLLTMPLINFLYGFYICLFLSALLIVVPLYKMFNKESLLNKKKIAFNSKLLKPWLAFGLLGSFFLPWINVSSTYLSGYELLLDETYRKVYWFFILVPLSSIMLVIYYRFTMKIKVLSFLTGITPYLVIVLSFIFSNESLFVMLSLGAYVSLCLGGMLIWLSLRYQIKKIFNKNKQ